MSYFIKNYKALKYPISEENGPGLRNAQLGAIHAIATYRTLQRKSPGIIVMPTGSGKTAVLMMAPYVVNATKVLVITPSVLVRGQIYEDFAGLKTLKKAMIFEEEIMPPKIYELASKYNNDFREEIESSDVIIATPKCALSLSEDDIKHAFDLVLVDEAHHVPAPTWQQILMNMSEASHYLFTATPFRRDKKEIRGQLLYSYPLSMAYRDGIFGEIRYIPIEEAPDKDLLIARQAERVLLNDRQQGFDHYLMVRTDSKARAQQLEQIYSTETLLKLKRIDSSMSFRTINTCLTSLKEKKIDGVICVDMLGEGFDFPNLKIAAVHNPHKSLASTLQFIGRFARTNAADIGPAKFIAMNDEELVIENNQLFTSDAIWQEIIVNMSEQAIQREEEIRKNISGYIRDNSMQLIDDSVSLYSLRPNCHAKVYHISEFDFWGSFPEACRIESGIYRNEHDNTVIGMGQIRLKPRWLEMDHILDVENTLFIVHFQQETSLLFIYSQIKSEAIYEAIAEAFTKGFDKIPRNEMHRVLGGLENFEIFNTGMQNRFAENGESYRIHSGFNVAESIDPSNGRMYSAGHVFCKAVSEINGDITIGYSSGSKIWSSSYMSITDYILWCDENGRKISNSSMVVKTNTNYDFLPLPVRIKKFPDKIFFAFFSDKTYSSPPTWINPDGELTSIALTDADIVIKKVSKDKILFSITIEDVTDQFAFTLDGKFHCMESNIFLRDGRNCLDLYEYINTNPLVFKTTDDSLIEKFEICFGTPENVFFVPDDIYGIDWASYQADIHCEFGVVTNGKKSIQNALAEILENDEKYNFIIYDHGSGEMADYITVAECEDTLEVIFYHVKAMSGKRFNSAVSDIYEVTQQAVKSTIWLKSRGSLRDKIRDRRRSKHCDLIRGKFEDLDRALKKDRRLTAKIVIVQPAISKKTNLPDKYQEVLAATRFYILNSGRVTALEIWGSL